MTIASLLLAFMAAGATPASDSSAEAILLDFHAEWCGPCHKARPAVEQLIRDGYPIKKVDIDQSPELARRYHVDSVPTFIVADARGRELDRTSGPQSATALARFYKAAAAKAQPPANASAHVAREANLGRAPATTVTTLTQTEPAGMAAQICPSRRTTATRRFSPTPSRGKRWSASA